jgi:hypothetical protein
MNLLKIRLAKGEKPKILDSFKRKPLAPLKMGFDYFINYKRFRELYYAKIPACNNVKLTHKDTCHPMKCESEAIKQLSMLHANAGGVGSGMLKDAIECLGSDNPSYGVTFILSDLKPGCTFTEVKINYDTFCVDNYEVQILQVFKIHEYEADDYAYNYGIAHNYNPQQACSIYKLFATVDTNLDEGTPQKEREAFAGLAVAGQDEFSDIGFGIFGEDGHAVRS